MPTGCYDRRMTVSPNVLPRMSVDEYLAYEHSQDVRHEFVDGYLYAMIGASERHERIAANLLAALVVHLRGSSCRAYKGDLKIVGGEDHYYPDVFVTCGPERPDGYSRDDPTVVVEVLSPSTARNDRGDKRLAYESLATLRDYVLVWQDRTRVEVRVRGDDAPRVLESPEDVLRLESIEFECRVAELYD